MGRLSSLQSKSRSALGVLTIVCGFFMMWWSARGSGVERDAIRDVAARAEDIDPMKPSGTQNGALVVAAASFSSAERLDDEFIKPGPYLVLRRRVEMYQWIEDADPMGGAPSYRLGWSEGQVDFFSFRVQQGHENPLLKIEPTVKRVQSALFGAFDGSVLLRSVSKLTPLRITPDLLKDSAYSIEDNKILVRRDPASSSTGLGDMRVWYEVMPHGDYTIMTRQVDERTLVGSQLSDNLVVREGLLTADEFFRRESEQSGQFGVRLIYLGALVLFFGVFSTLLPYAGRCSLRPRLNVDGALAVLVISVGVSGITLLAMLLLRLVM